MKNVYLTLDKLKGPLSLDEMYGATKTILSINNVEVLKKIVNSNEIMKTLEKELLLLNYSQRTKEQLITAIQPLLNNLMPSQIIDLILEVVKLIEMGKAIDVFDWLVTQSEEKLDVLKADQSQNSIVQSYFNMQSMETFFSGRVGKGYELISLLDKNKEIEIYAQDFVEQDLMIAEVRLQLADFKHVHLKEGNILVVPSFSPMKFDYIYDTPRFGYKPSEEEMEQIKQDARYHYFGIPSKMNADLGYLIAGIQALNDKGKGAFYLTTGALSRGGADEKIRERLVTRDVIEAIIEFPGGFFAPALGISSTLVLINMDKQSHKKGEILFINATTLSESIRRKTTLSLSGLKKINEIIKEHNEVSGISKIISASELTNVDLLPSRYIFQNEIELESYGLVELDTTAFEQIETVPLKEIATLYRGYNALPKDEKADGNVALLKISDLVDGEIHENTLTRYELGGRVKLDQYKLEKGDIVLSIRGQLKLAIFESDREDILLSQNFIGIRCHSTYDPAFIKLYLESPYMQFMLQKSLTGSTILHLSPKEVEGLLIPKVPLEKQQAIVKQYEQQQQQLKQQLNEIYAQLKNSKLTAYQQMGIDQTFILK